MHKEKAHWILLIVLSGYMLLTIGLMALISDVGGLGDTLRTYVYLSTMDSSNLGIFIALSVSLYIGNDFRNRTVNLKILAGHSRLKIFFGYMLISLIIFAVFFVYNALFCAGLSYLFLGGFGDYLKDILIRMALMLPPYLAITSIATFISMSLKSVLGIVMNIVVIMVLATLGSIVAMLSAFGVGSGIIDFITAVVPYTVLSSLSTGGLFGGFGGGGEETIFTLDMILKNVIGSAVFIAGAVTGGYFVFKSRPLT